MHSTIISYEEKTALVRNYILVYNYIDLTVPHCVRNESDWETTDVEENSKVQLDVICSSIAFPAK